MSDPTDTDSPGIAGGARDGRDGHHDGRRRPAGLMEVPDVGGEARGVERPVTARCREGRCVLSARTSAASWHGDADAMIVSVCDAGAASPVGPDGTAADTVNSLAGASMSLSSAEIVTVPVLDV